MVFYLHPEMQPYSELFDVNSSRIIMANEDGCNIQELLERAKY